MRTALFIITEDAETLKQRLQHEYDGRKTPRLQMLYLLASGPAQTRRDVAQLLGCLALQCDGIKPRFPTLKKAKAFMNRGCPATDENGASSGEDGTVRSDRRSLSTWCHRTPELTPDRENQLGTAKCGRVE